ncbi:MULTISPECIES: AMP-binding protein [Morganellaceae]|uniref:Gramicidin S synthase 2 n=1 Tax=Photorhabdus namnaonensis TaxID=1851568 RepID=A0A1B8YKN9_9GAMM|nr:MULTISPECIES: AMP-binding protein [Morganellaceae]OCA55688.1 Gramicidin S synthase 2 [Photorhabdus namnaonensis]PHM30335.1 Amino acid adenylation [Xenorhabdus szentirmaii DSM 16338]
MQSTLPIIKWRNILQTGQYRKYDISSTQPETENWTTLNNIKLPASFQRKECLPGLLFSHVRSTPWATAVIHGEERLSYLEMAIGSVHLACYLQNLGCLAGDCVGIFVEPSIEQMIGAWGTLFAGGAYLPLSHDYPEERLRYMIHDSNLKIIFTQEKLKEKLVRLVAENIHIVTLEDVDKSLESSAITCNILHDYLSPDNLACRFKCLNGASRGTACDIELSREFHKLLSAHNSTCGIPHVEFPCQPLSVPVSLKIALRGSKGFSVRYIPGLLSTTVKP